MRLAVVCMYDTAPRDMLRLGEVRYGSLRFGTVRCGSVRLCSSVRTVCTARCGALRLAVVRHGSLQYDTARCSAARRDTVQLRAVGTTRCDSVRLAAIRYGSLRLSTAWRGTTRLGMVHTLRLRRGARASVERSLPWVPGLPSTGPVQSPVYRPQGAARRGRGLCAPVVGP